MLCFCCFFFAQFNVPKWISTSVAVLVLGVLYLENTMRMVHSYLHAKVKDDIHYSDLCILNYGQGSIHLYCYFYVSIIGSALANLNLALYFNAPLMVFWWRFAVLMSEEDSHSRYYKSKLRFCPCSMCSHSLLRNGCVMTRHSKSGVPVTLVVQPLKHKCCRRRRVKFIVHSRDSRRVISLLLMLAGDVETNPGPSGM